MNRVDSAWDAMWERAASSGPSDGDASADRQLALAIRHVFDDATKRILELGDWSDLTPVRVVISGGIFEDGDGFPVDRDDRHFERVDVHHALTGEFLATFTEEQREDLSDAIELNGWEPVLVER